MLCLKLQHNEQIRLVDSRTGEAVAVIRPNLQPGIIAFDSPKHICITREPRVVVSGKAKETHAQ